MNCIDAQRQIMPFINNKLEFDQLEEFINHVNICPNCMDELEVYYVLLASMKQLDEDKELSNDFHQDLMNLITQSEERIFHKKLVHIRKKIALFFMIMVVAAFSSIRLSEYVVEDVLPREVTESNYRIDNLFHMKNTIDLTGTISDAKTMNLSELALTEKISQNLSDIYVYLKVTDPDGAARMEEQFGNQIWKGVKITSGIGEQQTVPEWTILQY